MTSKYVVGKRNPVIDHPFAHLLLSCFLACECLFEIHKYISPSYCMRRYVGALVGLSKVQQNWLDAMAQNKFVSSVRATSHVAFIVVCCNQMWCYDLVTHARALICDDSSSCSMML